MKKNTLVKESEIQRGVIEYLQWRKDVYFFRSNSFCGKIIRPNGSVGWIKNNKKGMPDLIVCFKGAFYALEIKSDVGVQSHEQKLAEAQIRASGGYYFIIQGEKWLEQLNVIFG